MKIGELGRRTGTKTVTIRYYEQRGLLPKPDRTEGNYRNYSERDLARLTFIRHCRGHGMSLEEIERLLQLSTDKEADHAEIHALIQSHLASIRAQIAELEQLEASLQTLLDNCGGEGKSCDILESLGSFDQCVWCRHHQEKDGKLTPLQEAEA